MVGVSAALGVAVGWWWGAMGPRALTWLSTSMAMSMNMSCSSRMLFSSLMISLCRVSISLRACFEILESMMIYEMGVVGWDPGTLRGRGWGPGQQEAKCEHSWHGQKPEQNVPP